MLYSDRKGVTDIRLDGITEIVTSPPTYLNKYAGWALIALFAALVAPQIMTRIPEVAEFATPAGGLLVALAIVEAALAIYYAKWTVTIKTAQSEYQFISNDSSLQNIPHAVRGAE